MSAEPKHGEGGPAAWGDGLAALAALRAPRCHAYRTRRWLYTARCGGDLKEGHVAVSIVDGRTGEVCDDGVFAGATLREMGVAVPDVDAAGPGAVRALVEQLQATGSLEVPESSEDVREARVAPPRTAPCVELEVIRFAVLGLLDSHKHELKEDPPIPQLTAVEPLESNRGEYVRLLNKARAYADALNLPRAVGYFQRAFALGGCAADYKEVCCMYQGALRRIGDAGARDGVAAKLWLSLLQYAGYMLQEGFTREGYTVLFEFATAMCNGCTAHPMYGAQVLQAILAQYLAEITDKHVELVHIGARHSPPPAPDAASVPIAPVSAWGDLDGGSSCGQNTPPYRTPLTPPLEPLGTAGPPSLSALRTEVEVLVRNLRAALALIEQSGMRRTLRHEARMLQKDRAACFTRPTWSHFYDYPSDCVPALDLHFDEEWLVWNAERRTPSGTEMERLCETYKVENRIEQLLSGYEAAVALGVTEAMRTGNVPRAGLEVVADNVVRLQDMLKSAAGRKSTRRLWRRVVIELHLAHDDAPGVHRAVAAACDAAACDAEATTYRAYGVNLHARRLKRALGDFEAQCGADAAAVLRAGVLLGLDAAAADGTPPGGAAAGGGTLRVGDGV